MKKQLLEYELIGPHFSIHPSRESIADWYKEIPRDESNHTVKHCLPFLDAMTNGYTIVLEEDVEVKEELIIGMRSSEATDPMPVPYGFLKKHFHWVQQTIVKLPDGYSALYTHPLNRFDLPFLTLSGIIDDRIKNGNIPFFIRQNFEGIIPKGTPIIQILPFKREDWKSEQVDHIHTEDCAREHNPEEYVAQENYRKERWNKKSYQ